MAFYTYIMTNKPRGTLYCGQTDDLNRRAWEHRRHVVPGFTDKYNCEILAWYEAVSYTHLTLPTILRV